jgi:deoxyribodipyrimidine photo-lyase
MASTKICIHWFRRDLRLDDNAALYHALKSGQRVLPVFIFDSHILNSLEDKTDARVSFIHDALAALHDELLLLGSGLLVLHDTPEAAWQKLVKEYNIEAVYTNRDYEPYARQRDQQIATWLHEQGIAWHDYKDQVIFDRNEVLKDNGAPYTVFTPYSKKWKAALTPFYTKAYPVAAYRQHFYPYKTTPLPTLEEIGFVRTDLPYPPATVSASLLDIYHTTRDFPALAGTTRLGVHLRFGTISIRWLARLALQHNETFLNELIWRDFYQMILFHFPKVVQQAFKPEYDNIRWRNNEAEFEKWCTGQTGYPIVDAGMRELNATGYMHNRVRMIVASFLTKHLLIDWRWGEAYFASKLLDYDLSANNGGWQWAAGTGCDAAPYFRIFNPYLQTQKFDDEQAYIRRWVPEVNSFDYPPPMVQHEAARKRCLEVYGQALGKITKVKGE